MDKLWDQFPKTLHIDLLFAAVCALAFSLSSFLFRWLWLARCETSHCKYLMSAIMSRADRPGNAVDARIVRSILFAVGFFRRLQDFEQRTSR